MLKIAVLGFGARGKMFSKIAKAEGYEISAVCDINNDSLEHAVKNFGVKKDKCFKSSEEFFRAGKLADVLIIATLDETHYAYAITALNIGYDILLEKPIA
ncbi:MAG: Gfo/Idh/MocA family oxidoreductase, partial [Clostridia bacterium]|nr:Gfo/Idh/MocA family oxidoreductase [Clostridia bacterium]